MRGRPRKTNQTNQTNQKSASLNDPPVSSPHGTENDQPPVLETEPQREVKKRGRPSNEKEELDRIEGMLRSSAMLVCGIGAKVNEKDAQVIYIHTLATSDQVPPYTPNLIASTMELARQDRKVRAYLAGLANNGAYLNIAVASGAIVMGIMANHNLLPPMFNPADTSPKSEQQSNV